MLTGKNIILGVCGGIAAYKALILTRLLRQSGAQIWPVLTHGGQQFVTPLSLATLAGRAPILGLWEAAAEGAVTHVELAQRADLLLVAPATADALARLAQGRTDDALAAIALSCPAPLCLAPAMETHMWAHPATQANLALLLARGAHCVPPTVGPLASGADGVGRLAEPATILAAVNALLGPKDLAGSSILVTAGPTREPLDPARFLSNASTGRMGFALAARAQARGAQVRLITGPTQLPPLDGVAMVHVGTTDEMLAAVQAHLPGTRALLMAAAPADWRPSACSPVKAKKGSTPAASLALPLTRTPDILLSVAARCPTRLVLGFAAETDDLMAHGAAKLAGKDLDMLVINAIGRADTGFASRTNAGWLLTRNAPPLPLPLCSKEAFADLILDQVAARLGGQA